MGSPGICTGISSGLVIMSDAAAVCGDYEEFEDWVIRTNMRGGTAADVYATKDGSQKLSADRWDEFNMTVAWWSLRYQGLLKACWRQCVKNIYIFLSALFITTTIVVLRVASNTGERWNINYEVQRLRSIRLQVYQTSKHCIALQNTGVFMGEGELVSVVFLLNECLKKHWMVLNFIFKRSWKCPLKKLWVIKQNKQHHGWLIWLLELKM